ncbi:MAG: helix-turn-helix transcriptional regulator [Chloracidobacterium sp.]|nr:helix-turn-helix transcriptional regulator [Chloracidobacterium sp.]MBK9438224.1 helix-turn-helix transcriptional regulator [Chloracidobacterium sp.]MBK9767633.1 helix-turn-helix transcriptional regulator [Chloracidobacterium sp.]MBL0240896.1 helix-turn-helix transcriptional regulator [Chloracidobacterium sp.]
MPKVNKAKVIELMAKKEIMTFKELAKALDISTTQLSNILSDKFEPVKSNIMELANFLEVSPLELIQNDSEHKSKIQTEQ